jgi:hypothetical protein
MAHRTVNALFDDYDHAAGAVRRLETSGIADLDVALVASNLGGAYTGHAARSFDETGADEAERYAEGVRRGGVLVSVRVRDADRARVESILDEAGRVEAGPRTAEGRSDGPAPPIGAAASTTTGLTTDLMPDPLDDDGTDEAQDERLRRITGADRDRT